MKSFKSFINESTSNRSRYITEAVKKIKGKKLFDGLTGISMMLDNLSEGDPVEVNVFATLGTQLNLGSYEFDDPCYAIEIKTNDNWTYRGAIKITDWKKAAQKAQKAATLPFKKHSDKEIAIFTAYDLIEEEGDTYDCYWVRGDEDSDSENMVLHFESAFGHIILEFVDGDLNTFLSEINKLK